MNLLLYSVNLTIFMEFCSFIADWLSNVLTVYK
jgi:hypothetical protein